MSAEQRCNCSRLNPPDANFCGSCGAVLQRPAQSSSKPRRGWLVAIAVSLALVTGGCWYAAGVVERVEVEPGIAVLDLGAGSVAEMAGDLLGGQLPGLRVEFELQLTNHNLFDVTLESCTWRASVGGEAVANGRLAHETLLAAGERTAVRFQAVTRPNELGAATIVAIRSLNIHPVVEAELTGRLLGISSLRQIQIDGFTLKPSTR